MVKDSTIFHRPQKHHVPCQGAPDKADLAPKLDGFRNTYICIAHKQMSTNRASTCVFRASPTVPVPVQQYFLRSSRPIISLPILNKIIDVSFVAVRRNNATKSKI